MKSIFISGLIAVALLGLLMPGSALANKVSAPPTPVMLTVDDNAKVFSESAIQKATSTLKELKSSFNEQVHIETTSAALSEAEKTRLKENKDAFWRDWAKAKATGERGLVIAINMNVGHVEVLADREIKNNGFNTAKENHVRDMLGAAFKEARGKSEEEARKIHDDALFKVATYLEAELPRGEHGGQSTAAKDDAGGGNKIAGRSILSWVCIGAVVLLGLWLIIGIFRALTGSRSGGGGGPGGYGGGGGGYGGGGGMGGGGFFSSLMGGMFGAAAGMWLYDQFSGHHSSQSYGDNNYGNDNSGGGGGDTGAGDFSGDQGSGGDFGGDDDSGGSGGDFGGGGGGDDGGSGGDFGGGGDGGGGGGDFGGGGGDFGGGGGDFGGGGGDFGGGGGDF